MDSRDKNYSIPKNNKLLFQLNKNSYHPFQMNCEKLQTVVKILWSASTSSLFHCCYGNQHEYLNPWMMVTIPKNFAFYKLGED